MPRQVRSTQVTHGSLDDAEPPAGRSHSANISYFHDFADGRNVNLELGDSDRRGFWGHLTACPTLQLAQLSTGSLGSRTTQRTTENDRVDYVIATFVVRGTAVAEQGRHVRSLDQGQFTFLESNRGGRFELAPESHMILVRLPHEWLGQTLTRTRYDPIAAGFEGHPMAALVHSFVRGMGEVATSDPAGAIALSEQVPSILSTLLRSSAGMGVAPEDVEVVQRERVLQFVERNFTDPRLDAAMIAQGCQLSRRSLYRLFSPKGDDPEVGSITALVRRLRLDRAKHLLASYPGLSTERVASMAGFGAPETFYRALRAAEDRTPAEYRALWVPEPAPPSLDPAGRRRQ